MKFGETLYSNYSAATPFALLLAKYVDSIAAHRKQHVLVVFTSALYRRLHSGIKRQTMKMLFDRARESLATVEEVIPNTGAQSNAAK